MNKKLKLALLEHPEPQYVVAQKMGVSETRLSRIIRERVEATPDECASLVELLGVCEKDIMGGSDFPEPVAAARRPRPKRTAQRP